MVNPRWIVSFSFVCYYLQKKMIQTLNLDIQSKQVLDGFIRLRALEIFYKKVLSLRLDNHRVSLASRSEKVLELENQLSFIHICQRNLEAIDRELQELGYAEKGE